MSLLPASTEETWLQEALLSNIYHGDGLALFAICFTLFLRQIKRMDLMRKLDMLVLTYIIFLLVTFFMACVIKLTDMAVVEYRNLPGGQPRTNRRCVGHRSMNRGMLRLSLVTGSWACFWYGAPLSFTVLAVAQLFSLSYIFSCLDAASCTLGREHSHVIIIPMRHYSNPCGYIL